MRGVLLRQERNGRLIGLVGLSCGTMSDVVDVEPGEVLHLRSWSEVNSVSDIGIVPVSKVSSDGLP